MNRSNRIETPGASLERHSGWVFLGTAAVTLLLLIPLFAMGSEEEAAGEPGGEVFDLRDDVADRFPLPTHEIAFIVESRGGDILTQPSLWELHRNTEALRRADERGELAAGDLEPQPYLFHGFDPDAERPFIGDYTLTDALQDVLSEHPDLGTSLEQASEEQVKLALHHVLSDPATIGMRNFLAVSATSERRTVLGRQIDYWTAPAMFVSLHADNQKLGGGVLEIALGAGNVDRERFNRNVQSMLRGEQQTYELWGIAIDLNLQSQDDGRRAGPFIMLTVIAALVVVGLSLRSYWAVALTGAGLGVLMIWLKGGANLIGIQGGLVVDLIVPIAMVSLGVDFAVHALRRYREERRLGHAPRAALRLGFAGVLGALVLAMLSDAVAFLANVSSPIDTVVEFGVTAALAVLASLIVLGVVVPLALMRIDELHDSRPAAGKRNRDALLGRAAPALGGGVVAATSGAGVILLVAVDQAAGVAMIFASIALTLGLPVLYLRRRAARLEAAGAEQPSTSGTADGGDGEWMGRLVTGIARRRAAVVAGAVALTAIMGVFALRLDVSLDVKDFFSHDSDMVVSLDKIDEHAEDRGGEPAIVYVRGDLTDPESLQALRRLEERLSANPHTGRGEDGEPMFGRTIFSLLSRFMASDHARAHASEVTGVDFSGTPGDGLPDTRAHLQAAYDYMVEHGVPAAPQTLIFEPEQVREVLYHVPRGSGPQVTIISVLIPGTRQQETVRSAQRSFTQDLSVLDGSPAIEYYGLTGSPFTRQASLDATTRSLQRSVPLAAAAVMALLMITMRSVRYAFVTIIPIGLVVAWLYGLMEIFGFSLNFVTATIGAVSIGVGIDYAIHMTARFREELGRAADKVTALDQAARGTGVALLASAASSVAGFAIMGLAPMPLFASYGILTALMIVLAAAASLLILPALLLLVTPEKEPARVEVSAV